MSQLFQLNEAEELDFGFYRIIKRHNRKVREFLGGIDSKTGRLNNGELAAILENSFQQLETDTTREKKETLQKTGRNLGLPSNLDERQLEVKLLELEKIPTVQEEVARYRSLRAELLDTHSAESDRTEVLNRLYEFYARHYQDGDFIVQRRYGKNGARYIKSTGDDTEFHWATEEMYYIKSGDVFADYPVVLPNGRRVVFCVDPESLQKTRADLKPTDRAYYKLLRVVAADKSMSADLRVELEYLKGSAKKAGMEEIVKAVQGGTNVSPDIISRHLRRYVARNQADFFIHKRLREALDEDLDIFLKTEVLNADQLLSEGATTVAARALRVARVIRQLSQHINAFLGVLEDHKKRLWEKKKLVLDTRYVITLDRLERDAPDWLAACIDRIVAVQHNEWQELGLGDFVNSAACRKIVSGDLIVHTTERYLPLPVDTGNFKGKDGLVDNDFKWSLLTAITANRALDDALDGVAIQSDNWQALNALQEKHHKQIKCCYIDPPYNTGKDGFGYKDAYKRASWMAMAKDRLNLILNLQPQSGALFASIDDNEIASLNHLIATLWGGSKILPAITNLNGNYDAKGFVDCHEYVIAAGKSGLDVMGYLPIEESKLNDEWQTDSYGLWKRGDGLRRTGQDASRKSREKGWFPVFIFEQVDGASHVYATEDDKPINSSHAPIYPIDSDGNEMSWSWSKLKINNEPHNLEIINGRGGVMSVYKKQRPEIGEAIPTRKMKSFLYKSSYSSTNGGNSIQKMFSDRFSEFTPKSVDMLKDLILVGSEPTSHVLDCFAGTGTCGAAVMEINRLVDKSARKFVLIEGSHHFSSILVPRLKKLGAANQWNNGSALDISGYGLFLRVQYIEQYEDTLENLAADQHETANLFDGAEALAYDLDDTLQKIALDSAKFVRPFGATLKRIVGAETSAVPVDLVESLIYLLGLSVDRLYREENSVVITGRRNGSGETIAVLWRDNVLHGAEWLQSKMAEHLADRIYTNEPGLLAFDGAEQLNAIEAVFVEAQSGHRGAAW